MKIFLYIMHILWGPKMALKRGTVSPIPYEKIIIRVLFENAYMINFTYCADRDSTALLTQEYWDNKKKGTDYSRATFDSAPSISLDPGRWTLVFTIPLMNMRSMRLSTLEVLGWFYGSN